MGLDDLDDLFGDNGKPANAVGGGATGVGGATGGEGGAGEPKGLNALINKKRSTRKSVINASQVCVQVVLPTL